MRAVSEYFGCMVFDDKVMQERLPPEIYAQMKRTVQDGRSLNLSIANINILLCVASHKYIQNGRMFDQI